MKNLRMSSSLKKKIKKTIRLIAKKKRKVNAKKRYILAWEADNFRAALCSLEKRNENKSEVKVVTDSSTGFVAKAMKPSMLISGITLLKSFPFLLRIKEFA